MPEPPAEGDAQPPEGASEGEEVVARGAGADHDAAEHRGGDGKGRGGEVPGEVGDDVALGERVFREEGRQLRPEGPHGEARQRHDGHGALDQRPGDPHGLLPSPCAEAVADQHGGRRVEGHAGQEEDGLDAQAGRKAGERGDPVEGHRGDQDEEHEVAGVPDQGRDAGRPRHLEQVGKAAPEPGSARNAAPGKQAQAPEQEAVGDGACGIGRDPCPGYAVEAEGRQAEAAEPRAYAQIGVQQHDACRRRQRGNDAPGRPEDDAGGVVDVGQRQAGHHDAPDLAGRRPGGLGQAHGAGDGLGEEVAGEGQEQAQQKAQGHRGGDVEAGPAPVPVAEGLADGRRGA